MWNEYYRPASLDEALRLLAEMPGKARLIAGATDLMLELERGIRKGIDRVIDITRLPGLDQIQLDEDGLIHLGPLVTHNAAVASTLLRERAFPLVAAAYQVGASQIRNRGTIAGNLITASPANDTITPLMALGAWLELTSLKGTRRVPLNEFYTGVRKTVMQPDEMLTEIAFPALKTTQRGTFLKLGLRRAQAISLANAAVILEMEADHVKAASITLGAVAPTIIHAPEAEAWLVGKELTEENLTLAGEHAGRPPVRSMTCVDPPPTARRWSRCWLSVPSGLLRDGREKADVPQIPFSSGGSRQ